MHRELIIETFHLRRFHREDNRRNSQKCFCDVFELRYDHNFRHLIPVQCHCNQMLGEPSRADLIGDHNCVGFRLLDAPQCRLQSDGNVAFDVFAGDETKRKQML